jgi:pyruvate/2-oxoglutarate dehydrogenase complex dihydrolipoamide dehydrogenase (E3) component
VPSKTLLDLAHRVAGAQAGQQWGLGPVAGVDFGKVMAHVHQVIDTISADESPAQLAAEGIELLRGWARLTSPTTLDVQGRTLQGSRLVLATGATAAVPPIDGLSEVPTWTTGRCSTSPSSRSTCSCSVAAPSVSSWRRRSRSSAARSPWWSRCRGSSPRRSRRRLPC